jgi:hypothetical protein
VVTVELERLGQDLKLNRGLWGAMGEFQQGWYKAAPTAYSERKQKAGRGGRVRPFFAG